MLVVDFCTYQYNSLPFASVLGRENHLRASGSIGQRNEGLLHSDGLGTLDIRGANSKREVQLVIVQGFDTIIDLFIGLETEHHRTRGSTIHSQVASLARERERESERIDIHLLARSITIGINDLEVNIGQSDGNGDLQHARGRRDGSVLFRSRSAQDQGVDTGSGLGIGKVEQEFAIRFARRKSLVGKQWLGITQRGREQVDAATSNGVAPDIGDMELGNNND
jgi:hypothetical protein